MEQTKKFETLLKHSKAVTGAAVVGVMGASPAMAALAGEDTLTIMDINVTLDVSIQSFDLDGDGNSDVTFQDKGNFGQGLTLPQMRKGFSKVGFSDLALNLLNFQKATLWAVVWVAHLPTSLNYIMEHQVL